MLLRNRRGDPGREGATLDRVRLNEVITRIAFGGRRRGVYTRITELSGARPGDRALDIGCGGGYRQLLERDGAAVPAGRGPGVRGVLPAGRAEVGDQQGSARAQHPVHLAARILTSRVGDVVRGQRAGDHIERPVGPGQVLGRPHGKRAVRRGALAGVADRRG